MQYQANGDDGIIDMETFNQLLEMCVRFFPNTTLFPSASVAFNGLVQRWTNFKMAAVFGRTMADFTGRETGKSSLTKRASYLYHPL